LASRDSTGGSDGEKQLGVGRDDKPPLIPERIRPWVWGWRPVVIGLAVFGLMQLVPYRIHNPAVVAEPKWDSPQTRALAVRACYNCHSNQTVEPWYSKVAPLSWWLTNHVEGGRNALNFSEWTSRQARRGRDAIQTIQRGSMPPSSYTWFGLHRDAKLTPDEQAALIAGLQATFANSTTG
jgi:Haem-binding domain